MPRQIEQSVKAELEDAVSLDRAGINMVLSLAAINWKKKEHLEPFPVCRILFPFHNLE